MFNLFKKKKEKEDWQQEKQMLLVIFSHLPTQFKFLTDQVNDGLIQGFRRRDSPIPNYHKIIFDVPTLNKYDKKEQGFFCIRGPEVFDLNSNKYIRVDVYYYSNVLQGYATPTIKEFRPDIETIRLRNYYLQSLESDDYDRAKVLLDKAALDKINPNDVYELVLDGKKYYHLKDLADGDFIGIDEEKKAYKITHDPYGFEVLSGPLVDILEHNS